jgi:hypothetical protein
LTKRLIRLKKNAAPTIYNRPEVRRDVKVEASMCVAASE